MVTLHIENTVRDFDSWKAVFDKFERFRTEQGVLAYRVVRSVTEPNDVMVDLEFDSTPSAEAFIVHLQQIWSTPQSKDELVTHGRPRIFDVITDRDLAATPSLAG
jgi:hypothetical protein